MGFEQDAELISGYNEWVTQRKLMASDVTPQAFLEDRMKSDAADRLIKALDLIEEWGEWDEKDEEYDLPPTTREVRILEEIIRGKFL